MSISCEDAGGKSRIDLVYSGDATGTLHVKAGFGEMDLPATKELRGDGAAAITGIRADGDTTALMPGMAALDDCVAGKLTPEQQTDKDLVFMQRLSCQQSVPVGATPVPVHLSAEIAVGEADFLYVYLIRTYLEKSRIGDEPIKVESLPPPNCKLVSRD